MAGKQDFKAQAEQATKEDLKGLNTWAKNAKDAKTYDALHRDIDQTLDALQEIQRWR
ncbi:hypothetical protein [Streptosporangium canum]|uniref:hypothetical protein n=1 Tax=Streptosporangium canum TaxID=324952 RepID=UPI0037B7F370